MITTPTRLEIASADIVKDAIWAGVNSEMADMDNPRGDFYEDRFMVEVVTASGRRFRHQQTFETPPTTLLGKVRSAKSIDSALWVETHEVYGSNAWQDADQEREMAWQSNSSTRGTVRDF